MANKFAINPRQTMVFGGAAAVQTTAQRLYSRLINGKQSYGVLLTARARLRILNNAATLLRNRGSVWALFNEVGVEENGRDTFICDGRVLRFLTEVHAPSTLTAVRAALAVATYNLSEQAIIWFAHPLSAQPSEVTYLERDARQFVNVFATLSPLLDQRLVTAGAGGAGVDAIVDTVTMEVEHIYDPYTAGLPYFIPRMRQTTDAIAAANALYPIFIKSVNPIRALAIQQDTSLGEVSDIISALALRSDTRDIIGPAAIPWDNLVRYGESEYGGGVYGGSATAATARGNPGAQVCLNFQRGGRLSNVLNPAQEVNLRFELNVAPTALAGAAASTVRVTILELERVPGLVAEEIPFPI
jgi:hypothetical protein